MAPLQRNDFSQSPTRFISKEGDGLDLRAQAAENSLELLRLEEASPGWGFLEHRDIRDVVMREDPRLDGQPEGPLERRQFPVDGAVGSALESSPFDVLSDVLSPETDCPGIPEEFRQTFDADPQLAR